MRRATRGLSTHEGIVHRTEFQPDRLQSARSIRGWSKKILAERVGVSAGAISHYESVSRPTTPSDDVLHRLATELRVRPEFFFGDPLPRTGGVFWRRVSRTPAALRQRYEELARLAGLALDELGEPLGSANLASLDISGLSPEDAALAVRAASGLKLDEPIFSAVDLLERFGLWTHELQLEDSATVDACSTRVDGRPIAFLNPAKADGYRTRYTSLHELYHMLAHSEPAEDRDAKNEQESEANRFASELLLPASVWADLRPRRGLNSPWSYLKAKGRYGISVKALMYKTRDFMTDGEYRYGMMRYSQLGWNQGEASPDVCHTAVDDDRPMRGRWLVDQFGSVAALADALQCEVQLAALLVDEPVDVDDANKGSGQGSHRAGTVLSFPGESKLAN